MAQLAIKGHPTRGKEIINLLEMLGANRLGYKDTFVGFYYYIECGAICSSDEYPTNTTIFTLEEFEEKYPYKVGDKVTHHVGQLLETHTIIGMRWDSDKCRILYYLDNCDVIEVEDILYSIKCKIEQSKQERVKDMDLKNSGTATIKYIQENGSRDMELIIPHNQEIVNIDGRYILRDKKLQYPKTYEECCNVLFPHSIELGKVLTSGYNCELLKKIGELYICRDAYWKIAGEQMRLGKPWKQDYDDKCFIVANTNGNIHTYEYHGTDNCILAFPTAEMRDAFYENFKDLIEGCKELL